MQYLLKFTNLGHVTNSFWMIVDRYQVNDYTRDFFQINTQLFLKNSFRF